MLKLHIQIHAGTHSHAHRHTHTLTHMLARAHSPQSCATFVVAQQGWGRGREVRSAFLPTFCFPLAQIMIPRHIPSHFNAPLSLSLSAALLPPLLLPSLTLLLFSYALLLPLLLLRIYCKDYLQCLVAIVSQRGWKWGRQSVAVGRGGCR